LRGGKNQKRGGKRVRGLCLTREEGGGGGWDGKKGAPSVDAKKEGESYQRGCDLIPSGDSVQDESWVEVLGGNIISLKKKEGEREIKFNKRETGGEEIQGLND